MTDTEFDILDELYFLQSYGYLLSALHFNDSTLRKNLKSLIEKGWVKCYETPTDEISFEEGKFEKEYSKYYYLASKQGLLVHNGNA